MQIENPDSAIGSITVSIGVATAALDQDATGETLIEAADRALCDAKCAGRNRVSGPP